MTLPITFLHPYDASKTYPADINPNLTAEQALRILHAQETGPFLPPVQEGERDEIIVNRTNTSIAPSTTMREAGVIGGDVLSIARSGSGAYDSNALPVSADSGR